MVIRGQHARAVRKEGTAFGSNTFSQVVGHLLKIQAKCLKKDRGQSALVRFFLFFVYEANKT